MKIVRSFFLVIGPMIALAGISLLSVATGEVRTEAAGHVTPITAPLSLDELTVGSERIFYGRVLRTSDVAATETASGLPVRRIQFEVIEQLKPQPSLGQSDSQLNVDYALPGAPAARQGEEVVWYLSKQTALGLTSLLDAESGDFRRVSRPSDRPLFLNRIENRGLWSNVANAQLWSSTFDRDRASDFLSAYLRRVDPRLAADKEALRERKSELLQIGDEPCRPRALPLEILLAATHSRLKFLR